MPNQLIFCVATGKKSSDDIRLFCNGVADCNAKDKSHDRNYDIKKYTKKEVKEKVAQIVSNSELEDNKKQMIINVVEVSCDE